MSAWKSHVEQQCLDTCYYCNRVGVKRSKLEAIILQRVGHRSPQASLAFMAAIAAMLNIPVLHRRQALTALDNLKMAEESATNNQEEIA